MNPGKPLRRVRVVPHEREVAAPHEPRRQTLDPEPEPVPAPVPEKESADEQD